MVRHIVCWNFQHKFSLAEREKYAQQIKQELEALKDSIPGIIELTVYTSLLPTGNKDVLLNSLFESEAALAAYQTHPEHGRVSNFVGTILQERVCADYIE
ncbi:Dabb family protein [Clostridia bacterium OttesenSCG-928-F22]|nr:Dabb family protein [Clostridia bacterium OttesenSCG-928-F22]